MAAKTPTYPDLTENEKSVDSIYCGAHQDGRIRAKLGDKKALITGSVFQLKANHASEAAKSVADNKLPRKLIHTTPGYIPHQNDESFTAFNPTKEQRFFITGTVHFLRQASSGVSEDAKPPSQASSVATISDTKPKPKKRKRKSFSEKLQRIAEQRAAGLDPDVRLSFITEYVGESRANLYRKMGNEFPSPVKRGKGSFWPMSVIEAYKSGKA